MITPYVQIPGRAQAANTIVVAKSGGDFDTIQGAIDSITDNSVNNQYNILVHAGLYTENVVGKNHVYLIGNGATDSIIIRATSGTLFTAPSTLSQIENIRLELNPTASGSIMIDSTSGGELRLAQANMRITSSTNGITSQLIKADSTAAVFLLRSSTSYEMTGSAGGSNDHYINQLLGSSSLIIVESDNSVFVSDVDDDYYWLRNQSDGVFLHVLPRYIFTHTNAAYSGTFRVFRHEKLGVSISQETSTMFLTGAGSGTAIVTSIDSDTNNAVIDSNYNQIRVNNWGTSYLAEVATGDTFNSGFDFNPGELGTTGAGTANFFGSFAYGEIGITGGTEYTIDTDDAWQLVETLAEGNSSANVDIHAGSTGPIASFADYSGTVGGTVLVTDVDHGMTGVETVSISATTNYNGLFEITVVNADTFYFTHSWDGDDATGTWRHGTEIIINQRGTYLISWAFSADSEGVNKVYELAAFNGTSLISGTKIARNFSNANDIGSIAGSSLTALEKGDHIYFAIRGTTDATNITLSEGNFTLSKIN